MSEIDIIERKLQTADVDQYSIILDTGETRQIRFSSNGIDLRNFWIFTDISIFAVKGKKMGSISFERIEDLERKVSELVSILNTLPDNDLFNGINPEQYNRIEVKKGRDGEVNIDNLVETMIDSSIDEGAERCAGVAYLHKGTHSVTTNFNRHEADYLSTDFHIRSFTADNSGEEALHFSLPEKNIIEQAGSAARDAARTSMLDVPDEKLEEGKYDAILSPYVTGNLMSYCSGLFSAYSVESGMSYFDDLMDQQIASDVVTLRDSPRNESGEGLLYFDDEGTPTKETILIERGILKTYLHSYSTAKKFNTGTTGNAGIVEPRPWQLSIDPGKQSQEDMISEMNDGIFIKNTWYTRFQDDRNAVFSTVPRDGIFRIKNGEIVSRIAGIRISDSFGRIFKNIEAVSGNRKNVKWWLEIFPSIMPCIKVNSLNITRSFSN
ncbi:MAG: metallopeptidase TldD-related protein [Thermoplasmataceae archaeon]